MQANVLITTHTSQPITKSNRQQQVHPFESEQLLADVRPRLMRLAQLRAVPPDAIEDVVQETLMIAWNKLDRVHSPEHASFWLDEICRKVCARFTRTSSKDASRQVSLVESPSYIEDASSDATPAIWGSNIASCDLDPAEMLSRQELADLLTQALHLLPDQARKAMESYYLLALSQREAALRLGMSISALETQLHRARRQLRQILNGDLRMQAASFDLPLGEDLAAGWQATSVWCYYCGHQRLCGTFETLADGRRNLRMRCPECSARFGFDIVNGKGLIEGEHLRSFQPAFKRTMRTLSNRLLQAISTGGIPCGGCARVTSLSVGDPKPGTPLVHNSRLQRRFWIRGVCSHCGYVNGGFSADDAVYWSEPVIQQFIQRYPHWLNEPDLPIDYQGQPAILFRLSDHASSAYLHVLTNRQTLQVLSIVQH